MIRLSEHHDWVIFILLGAILVFILVLQVFQRQAGLRDFFLQDYVDSGNAFPSWLAVSLVYIVLLSTLVSQYVPVVPKVLGDISIGGFSINKFGFTFSAISLFYFARFLFTFFFYSSIQQYKRWSKLYFVSTKFYFSVSVLLIIANFINYYIVENGLVFLRISLVVLLFIFIFKLLFFAFNKNYILPREWYYKFLYICTLQFAPLFALGKLLFF